MGASASQTGLSPSGPSQQVVSAADAASIPSAKNTVIWDALSKTDPAHTKGFNRAGGFSGTAIKPIWIIRKLTEQFGPCGTGWGINEPKFETVQAGAELLVFCTVSGWHGKPQNVVWGIGGDKVVTLRKSGPFNDDEAFKKAFTDAVGNAFKFVGVGADVHMGLFEDSKYLAQVREEYHPREDQPAANDAHPPQGRKQPERLKGPIKTRAELRTACGNFVREIHACGDIEQLECLLSDQKALIKQVQEEHEFYWLGDGADFSGLQKEINNARASLEQEADEHTERWRNDARAAG